MATNSSGLAQTDLMERTIWYIGWTSGFATNYGYTAFHPASERLSRFPLLTTSDGDRKHETVIPLRTCVGVFNRKSGCVGRSDDVSCSRTAGRSKGRRLRFPWLAQ